MPSHPSRHVQLCTCLTMRHGPVTIVAQESINDPLGSTGNRGRGLGSCYHWAEHQEHRERPALPGDASLRGDPVLPEFVIEGGAAHLEHHGGLALVPAGRLDGLLDHGLFGRRSVSKRKQWWV